MIPVENQRLIEAIEAPAEHWEFISTIVDRWRDYGKQKGYSPIAFKPIREKKYFCAYKQGASSRGEGAAIVCFENRGEGLCLVFHHVVVDLKAITVQTQTDEENRWRRIRINRPFSDEQIQYICKLCYQCFDKVFR